jgi:recombination protein RecT
MADEKKNVALRNNIGDQVIGRLNELAQANFNFPKDYNYVNAIKMSVLKLQELKDKDKRPALEVCDPVSISSALFKMATKGLNLAYNQAYAVVRGTDLCIDPGYFGNVLMVKRIFPDWEPMPHSIREGDEYVTEVDPKTGKKKLLKHVQKLENLDKDFIGGYIYLPSKDGEMYLYEMTRKQILTAWSKSSSREQATHKQFDEKMLQKTLVNSGCTMIINSTPELKAFDDDDNEEQTNSNLKQLSTEQVGEVVEYEEVTETVDASTLNNKEELSGANASVGEPETIKEEKKKQVKARPF